MTIAQWREAVASKAGQTMLTQRYGGGKETLAGQTTRYLDLLTEFEKRFGTQDVRLFSACGRTEISGNHTDHNHGLVLAAAVDSDMVAVVAPRRDHRVNVFSVGYPRPFVLDLHALTPNSGEKNSSSALIRGMVSGLNGLGYRFSGFDACLHSNVLRGSGLSSSAAFEILISVIIEKLFNEKPLDGIVRAKIAQAAENKFFGKPCGLMDQMASSLGAMISIDFADIEKPKVERMTYDFDKEGYALAVVNTGDSHAGLTSAYAAVRNEMNAVAKCFRKSVLRDVPPELFYANLAPVRKKTSDRSVLRAMHFYEENNRVMRQTQALKTGNTAAFLEDVIASGRSSFQYLQNVYVGEQQGLSLALAMSERLLADNGAWRVHGGGFAGTILAFVPKEKLPSYAEEMNRVFGENACLPLSIAQNSGVELVVG